MVVSCSAYGCTNRAKKGVNISFYRFPADPNLRKKWVIATKREGFVPSNHSKLCSQHFQPDDVIYNFGQNSLKPGVIPTLFNFPKHLQKRQSKPRSVRLKTAQESGEKKVETKSSEKTERKRRIASISGMVPMAKKIGQRFSEQSPSSVDVASNLILSRKRSQLVYMGDIPTEDLDNPKKIESLWQILHFQEEKVEPAEYLMDFPDWVFCGNDRVKTAPNIENNILSTSDLQVVQEDVTLPQVVDSTVNRINEKNVMEISDDHVGSESRLQLDITVACPTNCSDGGNSVIITSNPESNILNSSDSQTVDKNLVSDSIPQIPELVDKTMVNSLSSKINQNNATEIAEHLKIAPQIYCNENQYNSGAATNGQNKRSTGAQTNLFDEALLEVPQEPHVRVNRAKKEEILIIVEEPHFKSVKIFLKDCNRTTEVCRICLQSVEDDEAIKIDSVKDDAVPIMTLLKFVLPDLHLGLYPNAVICTKCGELLMFSYQFKEKWLITEDILQNMTKEKQDVTNEAIDLVIVGKSKQTETQDTETVDAPVINNHDTNSEEITNSNLTSSVQEILDVQTVAAGEEILHESSSNNGEASAPEPVTVKRVKKRKRYIRSLYLCEKCRLIFVSKKKYQYHLIKHRHSSVRKTRKRDILCEVCGQLFITTRTLEFHLQKHSRFNCTVCAKVFTNKTQLHEHVEVQHLRNVSHQCHICGKQLSCKEALDKHMLQHNPANKVVHHLNVCEFCHRIYWKKHDLERHKIRTHSVQEYGEAPNGNKNLEIATCED